MCIYAVLLPILVKWCSVFFLRRTSTKHACVALSAVSSVYVGESWLEALVGVGLYTAYEIYKKRDYLL